MGAAGQSPGMSVQGYLYASPPELQECSEREALIRNWCMAAAHRVFEQRQTGVRYEQEGTISRLAGTGRCPYS